jgi:hypothetical protein
VSFGSSSQRSYIDCFDPDIVELFRPAAFVTFRRGGNRHGDLIYCQFN